MLRTAVYIQDACYLHQYIRSNDLSTIVERPERLRALNLGISAAIAQIEASLSSTTTNNPDKSLDDDLTNALQNLDLTREAKITAVDIIKSQASSNLLNNKAIKFVHGDIDGDVYLENMIKWAKESVENIKLQGSEIPSGLPQGDLYLSPESITAIQGALGTVCEATDAVMQGSCSNHPTDKLGNAFVSIRPPGHHCGEDTPSGFCFVNNVIVAAAHAHLEYGVEKVVIFDIDLHHGNGTQALAWQINEESYRIRLEADSGAPSAKPGLQVFYGSLHDILSFPCEDGNPALVQAASVSIHGPHGQHIENIHLQPYQSEEDFWANLYPNSYSKLFDRAKAFTTGTNPDKVLTFISCGFDACEHEYESMSRHGRRVPTSFYYRFAADARKFAAQCSNGKLISVLEGGYSDRALISGGMAHLCGLIDENTLGVPIKESWWNIDHLIALEKATKKKRGARASLPNHDKTNWLNRALTIFNSIETPITPSPSRQRAPQATITPSTMTLRERKPPSNASAASSTAATPKGSPVRKVKTRPASAKVVESPVNATIPIPLLNTAESVDAMVAELAGLTLAKETDDTRSTNEVEEGQVDVGGSAGRKHPKVILRVKDPPPATV